ncbi:MAG: hypothetical protein J6A77_09420 [Lachnospiraceae bacterium]|nr:hypothetical protein [Lachnospiraceae bacterium]
MTPVPDSTPDSFPFPFRSHTAHLLAAALPFLQPSCRHPIELLTKFLEFSETLKLFQEFHLQNGSPFSALFHDAAQAGQENGLFGMINFFITDLEGLLGCLSRICTGDEREIISMFLNVIRAKNFYDTYGDLLNMGGLFSQNTDSSDSSFGSGLSGLFSQFFQGETVPGSDGGPTSFSGNPVTPETQPSSEAATSSNTTAFPPGGGLTSMLNEDQKETLELLKSLFASD